jgi:hypothetical protein
MSAQRAVAAPPISAIPLPSRPAILTSSASEPARILRITSGLAAASSVGGTAAVVDLMPGP